MTKEIEKSVITLELEVGDIIKSKKGFLVNSAITDAKYRVFEAEIAPNGGMVSRKRVIE